MATKKTSNFILLKYSLIVVLTLSLIGTIVLLIAAIDSLCDSYETINRYERLIDQLGSFNHDFHDLLRNVPFNPLTTAKQQENTSIILLIIYSISLTVEVIGLIGAVKENEVLMFISPTVMAILTVMHFFIGQRPKAMTVLLSFTVTLLAFIYIFVIRRERRIETMRSRTHNMNIREMRDLVATTSGNLIIDKERRYVFTDIKPPPYDQVGLDLSVK